MDKKCKCNHHHSESGTTESTHDHNYLSEEEVARKLSINLEHHENTTMCSLKLTVQGIYNQTCNNLQHFLENICDWIEKEGGIIGHIKGTVKEKNRVCFFSTTGHGISTKEYLHPETDIDIILLTLCINDELLVRKVKELILDL